MMTEDPLLKSNSDDSSSLVVTGDDESNSTDETPLSLRIKSFRSVEISARANLRISEVKQLVTTALGPTAQGRYLRLICKGRLLAPDTALLREFAVHDGDCVHAVLAADGVRGGQQAALSRGATSRRYRGTGVGPLGRLVRPTNSPDADSDDSEDELEEGQERLGFDRLRASGLTRGEITAIRSYFSRHVDRFMQQHQPPLIEEEEDLMRRRLLYEDAWMQAQGPTSEFRLNLNQTNPLLSSMGGRGGSALFADGLVIRTSVGTDRDFLWGFLLGFFVGFLMLVWVWLPTVPHKQKLGILTGISLQLAMTLLRSSDDGVMDVGV